MAALKERKKRDLRHFEAINYTVGKILTSKLLLDEDQEVVFTYWKLTLSGGKEHEADYRVLYGLLASFGIFTNLYHRNLFVTALCSIPITFTAAKEVYRRYKARFYKLAINNLVATMTEVHNLIKKVIQYLRAREAYLLKTRTTIGEDMYIVLMAAEESFTRQLFKAFKNATSATQIAIKKNCETNSMCAQAYKEMANLDLSKSVTFLSKGNYACIIKDVFHEYCLMMSSFLGSLVVKVSLESENPNNFHQVMTITVTDLTDSLIETLKQEQTFNKLQKLYPMPPDPPDTNVEKLDNNTTDMHLKQTGDILVYFKTGYDLVHHLHNCIKSKSNDKLKEQIQGIIALLQLSSYKIDVLHTMMPKNKVNPIKVEPTGELQILSEPKSETSCLIRHDEPEEIRIDEEFECITLDEPGLDDINLRPNFDDFESQDLRMNRLSVITELNQRLLTIREQKESQKESRVHAPTIASMTAVNPVLENREDYPSISASVTPVPSVFPDYLSLDLDYEKEGASTGYHLKNHDDCPTTSPSVPPMPPPLPEFFDPEDDKFEANVPYYLNDFDIAQAVAQRALNVKKAPEETFGYNAID